MRRNFAGINETRRTFRRRNRGFQIVFGGLVDHRADMGGDIARIADRQFARRARDHRDHLIGDIFLQAKKPQRRAALPRRAEGGGDDIIGDLLRQCRRIDDHRIDAAGFGNERHDRARLWPRARD